MGRCLHVSVTKFQDKFASLQQVNSPIAEITFKYVVQTSIWYDFYQISRYFACFYEFRGFTWISRLSDRAKYQKPCKVENVTSRPVVKWYQGRKCSITVVKWYQGRNGSITVVKWYQGRKCSITVAKWYQGRKCSITVAKWYQGRKCSITVVKWYQGRKCSITVAKWYQGRIPKCSITVAKWYQGRTPFAAVLNFFYFGFYTRLRFCSTNNLVFPSCTQLLRCI